MTSTTRMRTRTTNRSIINSKEPKMDFQCPMCGKIIPSATTTPQGRKHINAPFFPFCSERCRLLDLGAWLDERYRVPSEAKGGAEDEEGISDID